MKNVLILGLFVLAMVFAQFAQAQTVDEIVDKYVNNLGGAKKLESLTSIRKEGSMNVQGADVNIVLTVLNNVGSRQDISVMGTENYVIILPKTGWKYMPVQGATAPEEFTKEMANASFNSLDAQGVLFNYNAKGNKVSYEGKETIHGQECFKLKVINKLGSASNFFIDTKTYFLVQVSSKMNVDGNEIEQVNSFSNFKQNADGYWFAYTSKNAQGEVTFDKIETNIKVDESIFKAN